MNDDPGLGFIQYSVLFIIHLYMIAPLNYLDHHWNHSKDHWYTNMADVWPQDHDVLDLVEVLNEVGPIDHFEFHFESTVIAFVDFPAWFEAFDEFLHEVW